jgi:Transcriptional regulators
MSSKIKKRITIYDIARELNTSASTVSRALQDHPGISQDTKDEVLKLAEKLGYQPNMNARSLKTGKGNTIGVVVPLINRNFFSSAIDGIEEVASKSGYEVIISQSKDMESREKHILEVLSNGKVDGLIISVASETSDFSHLVEFAKKGIPIVLFDRIVNIPNCSKVCIDDFQGAFNAVTSLLEQGCRKIFHFAGSQNVSIWENRYKGYLAALDAYGIKPEQDWVFYNSIAQQKGEEAVKKMLLNSNLPDAIFSSSDFSALGAMIELKKNGIKVPDQVAIVGFANEPFDDFIEPALSSVNQYSKEMGRVAAELLFEKLNGQGIKQVILQPELIRRASSIRNR